MKNTRKTIEFRVEEAGCRGMQVNDSDSEGF
jgi:hypothetical protein